MFSGTVREPSGKIFAIHSISFIGGFSPLTLGKVLANVFTRSFLCGNVPIISESRRFGNRSGLIGRVTYAGELAEFVPFVGLGAFLHVGKNATFGLGKYGVASAH